MGSSQEQKRKLHLSSLVKQLLKATGVLLIPGTGFGPSMNYGFRLFYGPLFYEHEQIIEGIERISQYLAKTS